MNLETPLIPIGIRHNVNVCFVLENNPMAIAFEGEAIHTRLFAHANLISNRVNDISLCQSLESQKVVAPICQSIPVVYMLTEYKFK